MRSTWLSCLLLGGLAFAQMAQPASPPQPAAPAEAKTSATAPAEVTTKPDDPVITVKAPCDDPAKKGQTCDTIVTREQFEKLSEALQPNMSPPIKIRLANAFAKLTAMSKEAEKRGLDKSPRFEEN